MTPFLLFKYLLALSGGVTLNGLALLLIRAVYVWVFAPSTERPTR